MCMQYKDSTTTITTILECALETITLGLLYINYRVSIKEGDGDQVKNLLEVNTNIQGHQQKKLCSRST